MTPHRVDLERTDKRPLSLVLAERTLRRLPELLMGSFLEHPDQANVKRDTFDKLNELEMRPLRGSLPQVTDDKSVERLVDQFASQAGALIAEALRGQGLGLAAVPAG